MATINKTKDRTGVEAGAHLNWMAGNSWDISNPIVRLRIAASSCFFGEPMYYHATKDKAPGRRTRDRYAPHAAHSALSESELRYLNDTLDAMDPRDWRGLSPDELMVKAIDEALAFDPEATLQIAVNLRSNDNIRVTPQVILVRAANLHSGAAGDALHAGNAATGEPNLIRKYGPQIIQRLDEVSTQMAYQFAAYGKPIPNSLKDVWRNVLQGANEYGLAKYRMDSREVKTVDVVNMTHPSSAAVDKLVREELKQTGDTWEAIISEKGSTKAAWTEAIDHMGHMALLRNLANLIKATVEPSLYLDKLRSGVATGRQLPFRYFSAYKVIEASAPPQVLDAVSDCLNASFANLPQFSGRVMSLCDNSGSAWGTTTSSMGTMHIAEIANLTAIVTGMASEEGYIGVFGDRLQTLPVRKSSSIIDQLVEANRAGTGVGGGTENGVWLFWDQAIRKAERWDTVFIYSDMQAGHGGLYGTDPSQYGEYAWPGNRRYIDVPKLINTYRAKVNPDVNVFLVQVAGYQDTLIPANYRRTYILGGWSDAILRYAASMIEVAPQQ